MSQSAGRFQAFPEPGGSDLHEAFCTGRGFGSSSNPEGWILGSPDCLLYGLRHRRKCLPLALPTTKPSPIPITVKFKQAKRCLVYA